MPWVLFLEVLLRRSVHASERLVLARQALSDNRVRFVRMGDLESGKYRCKFDIISSLTQVDVNWTMAAFKTWNRNGVFMCHYNVSV